MDKNAFIEEVFNTRYTCKGYDKDKKLSEKDFRTIIEAGRLSPSSMGFEPWLFVHLKNRSVLDDIRPFCWGAQNAIDNASHFILLLARTPEDMHPDSEYLSYIQNDIQHHPQDILEKRREKFRLFYEDDFKLSSSDRAVFDWTCKQCYIVLANMLTAAAILKVDSTPIEGFHQDKVHEVLVQHKVYDPKHFKIACMLALGYKNRDHRPKTRRSFDEVLKVF